MKKTFDPTADYQPEHFEFSKVFKKHIAGIIALYPPGRQKSAVMPLLDMAQRQVAQKGADASPPHGGWIPRAAMDHIAEIIDIPKVKIYEVASFYNMYNTAPVGKYLLQVCTTTPCHICGCGNIVGVCKEQLDIGFGETTEDGKFTLVEAECLGACVNAPVVQINDDYYEDLSPDSIREIIAALAEDIQPTIGSQKGRKGSMSMAGPTTLLEHAKKAKVV